jgi:uncharacterized membrane protein
MQLEFRNKKDFWSGVMFVAIGCAAMIGAQNYPFGSTFSMGPGYMPTLLGGILTALGICIFLRGLRNNENMKGNWSMRSLIVLPLAMVLFGVLMEYAGFVPAMMTLTVLSGTASRDFKWVPVLLSSVILTVICSVVFVLALGLPFPLIKGF